MRRVPQRGVKYFCRPFYHKALSQVPGDSCSRTQKPTVSGPSGAALCSVVTSLAWSVCSFSLPSILFIWAPSSQVKKKSHLLSLNESWEPFTANVQHSGAAEASRGKAGTQGSKGSAWRVDSEVGGTWLLWDETHSHKPKRKPAQCLWEWDVKGREGHREQ